MKITFKTNNNCKYLYHIKYKDTSKEYNSWLENIEGNCDIEFTLQDSKPIESILELKSFLNNKGIIIEHVESIQESFLPEEGFQEIASSIEG